MLATSTAASATSAASPAFAPPRTTRRIGPLTLARSIAVLFLATIVLGIVGEASIAGRLVVDRDPATTANNIVAHASLLRAGFSVYLVEMMAQIAMTALFYELLRPVSRPLSMLSAVFGYVGCGIKTMSRLFFLAPVLVLGGTTYADAFNPAQREGLSWMLLQLNTYGAGIALAFFGVSTLIQGYLIVRSTFLPRSLGILTMMGGLGWLAFVSPTFGLRAFPIVAGIGLLGSIAMILWLGIAGVNEPRWREQAAASPS